MYDVFLFVHSWFRWIVVVAGLRLFYILIKAHIGNKTWSSVESSTLALFNEALFFQVAIGLPLYLFLSPLPKIGWSNLEFAFRDPAFRFWTIEHPVGMLSGFIVFQVGRFLALKKYSIEKRLKIITITLTLSFLIIICSIPWPFLKHGRNLFRFYF